MIRKNNVLWNLVVELYGDRIAIYMVLGFAFGLKVAAWIIGFIPAEHQGTAFIFLSCIIGFSIAFVLKLLKEVPSFIVGFFRGRY